MTKFANELKTIFYVRFPNKFGPDRFSRFDVYWIQTDVQTNRHINKQTNRQADKLNLYIDRGENE